MREAPAIPLIEALLAAGRHGAGLRSRGDEGRQGHLRRPRHLRGDQLRRAQGRRRLAIVTEWNEFRRPDFERMRTLMRTPVIFDGRNLFTPEQMKQHGFTYYSIGRQLSPPTRPRHRRRRLHRQPAAKALRQAGYRRRHLRQPVGRPPRGGARRAAHRRRHRATSTRCGGRCATPARRR